MSRQFTKLESYDYDIVFNDGFHGTGVKYVPSNDGGRNAGLTVYENTSTGVQLIKKLHMDLFRRSMDSREEATVVSLLYVPNGINLYDYVNNIYYNNDTPQDVLRLAKAYWENTHIRRRFPQKFIIETRMFLARDIFQLYLNLTIKRYIKLNPGDKIQLLFYPVTITGEIIKTEDWYHCYNGTFEAHCRGTIHFELAT